MILLVGLFVFLAVVSGALGSLFLNHRRTLQEERRRERDEAAKVLDETWGYAERLFEGTGLEDSTRLGLYYLRDLPLEDLRSVRSLADDMELGARMQKFNLKIRLEEAEQKLAQAEAKMSKINVAVAALEQIKADSATVGYDSGDAGIHRTATKALAEILGKTEDTGSA